MPKLGIDEPMRILLVSEHAATRQELDQILSSQVDKYRLDWVELPEFAAVRAKDLSPHVILLDDQLAGADITVLIRHLSNWTTNSVILALVEAKNIDQIQRAVLAGARGFLKKPLTADDVIATLSEVLLHDHSTRSAGEKTLAAGGRIIAFCSPKGGTGCSTIAVNTALALHRLSRRTVVLVDANIAAPALDSMLNLHERYTITDLCKHLPRIDSDLLDDALATHGSGVRVLLAPSTAEPNEPPTASQMQQILAQLKRSFDWVMVDLGVESNPTAFAVLDAADRIVLPLLPEMSSLGATRHLLDRLMARGYPESKVWPVLNRSTMRSGLSRATIERRVRLRIQQTIADDQPLVTQSINRGVPVVISYENSAIAKSMHGLAQRFAQDANLTLPATGIATTRNNPFQRWLRSANAINA